MCGWELADASEMIRKILFPVDFSPSCAAITAYDQRAATLYGATVSLVHLCGLRSHGGFALCETRLFVGRMPPHRGGTTVWRDEPISKKCLEIRRPWRRRVWERHARAQTLDPLDHRFRPRTNRPYL